MYILYFLLGLALVFVVFGVAAAIRVSVFGTHYERKLYRAKALRRLKRRQLVALVSSVQSRGRRLPRKLWRIILRARQEGDIVILSNRTVANTE